MRFFFFIVLIMISFVSFSQYQIKGIVKDTKDTPVFAANVYLKSNPEKGCVTDFDGKFSLNAYSQADTIIVSFIGFETKEIALSTIDLNEFLSVILAEKSQKLEEVTVRAQDPISEQFSVVKMKKMDIYLNPVSQADPLKAITVLPASTTVNETANVSLRGSSTERSRVSLNGVPIYKPVRASQLNNQGFFSLFNPEIIDKQYVYASNPPLTYGNTSAGLVEIQTIKKLKHNQLQVSASLASIGFFLSQRVNKDISFVQVYGNYQFSDAFTAIQQNKLPNLKNFYTTDAGINFHRKIAKKIEFNSYNYFIDEQFKGINEQFTYKGNVLTDKKRFFTVNNLAFYFKKAVLSINSGVNNSKQHYRFGSIYSEQEIYQIYTSIDYNWHMIESTNLQFGISNDYHRNKFNDSIPTYYYALSPQSPNYYNSTSIDNSIFEAYLYTNWNVNDKLTFSSGTRSNLPLKHQKFYLSSQMGLKYRVNNKQSFLLSGGRYYSYSIPNYFSKKYNLLSSNQVALDYTFVFKNTLLKAAAYIKNEIGEQSVNRFFDTDKVNTFGLEFFVERNLYKYFKLTVSNSFIDQKMTIDHKKYPGPKDFNYLLKATVQYNNSKLFSLALTYISRPGIYYNKISNSLFDEQTGFYEPVFSENLYTEQYDNYQRLDISINKFIPRDKNALILFVSLNNVLDKSNQQQDQYNTDYTAMHFDYYQFRTIYFGVVWLLNY